MSVSDRFFNCGVVVALGAVQCVKRLRRWVHIAFLGWSDLPEETS